MNDDDERWYLLVPVLSGMGGIVSPAPQVISEDALLSEGLPSGPLWGHWEAYRIDGTSLRHVKVIEHRTVRYEVAED